MQHIKSLLFLAKPFFYPNAFDGKVSLLLLTCYKLSSAVCWNSFSFICFSTMYFVCLSRAGSLKNYYFLRARDNSLCQQTQDSFSILFVSFCFVSLKTQEQSGVCVVLTSNRITCGTMLALYSKHQGWCYSSEHYSTNISFLVPH